MPSASADDANLTAFARLLGRQPSDAEATRLFQVKDALGIRDNDALWIVLLALENYDAQFRRYPALLQGTVDETLERVREAMAKMAEAESRKAGRVLAESVTATALSLASRQQAINAWLVMAWTAVGGALLCGLCLAAGAVLASGSAPDWYAPHGRESVFHLVAGMALRAPVGWLVVAAGAAGGAAAVIRGAGKAGKALTFAQKLSAGLLLASAVGGAWLMFGTAILS